MQGPYVSVFQWEDEVQLSFWSRKQSKHHDSESFFLYQLTKQTFSKTKIPLLQQQKTINPANLTLAASNDVLEKNFCVGPQHCQTRFCLYCTVQGVVVSYFGESADVGSFFFCLCCPNECFNGTDPGPALLDWKAWPYYISPSGVMSRLLRLLALQHHTLIKSR